MISAAIFALVLGMAAIRKATFASVICYVASLVALIVAILTSLGIPRPAFTYIPSLSDVTVITELPDEPHAIYLWVLEPGSSIPISLKFPWSESAASQFQNLTLIASQNGTLVKANIKRGHVMFYNSPIQELPAKHK